MTRPTIRPRAERSAQDPVYATMRAVIERVRELPVSQLYHTVVGLLGLAAVPGIIPSLERLEAEGVVRVERRIEALTGRPVDVILLPEAPIVYA